MKSVEVRTDEGNVGYRTDNGGVDIVATANGYAIGYTAQDEWLEYTIDVQQAGEYEFRASVASGLSGAAFRMDLVDGGVITQALAVVKIPQTANGSWDTYSIVHGKLSKPLAVGRQTLRFTVTGPNANLDKIKIWCPAAGIEAVAAEDDSDAPMYDLTGRRVGASYRGMAIRGGQRIMIR